MLDILAFLLIAILSLPAFGGVVSPDGWELIDSLPQTNTLRDVIWDGGQFIAVGDMGTILASPDGRQWTPRVSGTTNDLNAIAHNPSKYVAVGSNGTIVASNDGITWLPQVSGTTLTLNDIAANDDEFIAVGVDGVYLTNSSGDGWGLSIRNSVNFRGVLWDGERFVAVTAGALFIGGNSGWEYFSYVLSCGRSVSWNGAFYAVAGTNDCTFPIPGGDFGEYIQIVEQDGETSPYPPAYSDLGGLYSIYWTGERFVAVGVKGDILVSDDGTTWGHSASGSRANLYGVGASASATVVVGESGVILVQDRRSLSLPNTVPTVGLAGLILMGLILAIIAIVQLRRFRGPYHAA